MRQNASSQQAVTGSRPQRKRVVGIDAARGVALIGLLATHIFPNVVDETGEPTLAQEWFAGDSAALFVLLAGVGLALLTGGHAPHRGLRLSADRAGVAVRGLLVGIVGLLLAAIMPPDPPAYGILLYFGVYFLLAIPFLSLGPKTLFAGAAVFLLVGPVLMQRLRPTLPESSNVNHTVVEVVTEPAGIAAEVLLTGSYPALCFMVYILVGLGLGRLNLNSLRVQTLIVGIGAALAVAANAASFLLLRGAGGYQALLATDGMDQERLDEAMVFGPDVLPDTSAWWLAIAAPHANTPIALASSVGTSMVVLGVFLLISRKLDRWLAPLTAMGAMTMTVYSAHMVALSFEVHYGDPVLWYVVQLSVAVVFAVLWTRWLGRGPLEWVMASAARPIQRAVMDGAAIEAIPQGPTAGEASPTSTSDQPSPRPAGEAP